MEQTLELHFLTELGKTIRIIINDPKEDLLASEIQAAMEQLIQSNIFLTESGPIVSVKEARLIERNINVFEY
ncbi:DUF2922 domain-containing protein [Caldibacillus lycopersici]|uniref:DUF2922 domain-containing protein n=1 Tax=Perspicuibacillus lycopersici TaxID=1325689 RepID=A0AAE3LRP2_9BACI|nr:DUF2922 domain-containing protein [Perspicuibacillus lycopersici]MCU9611953.1 DUF2922 domain-containing protein [Perspicuibacillus lycopersici]